MAKDRITPCEYYICAHAECKKGRTDVTMDKCQTCTKYRPRKQGNKKYETIQSKRNKSVLKDIKKYQKEY